MQLLIPRGKWGKEQEHTKEIHAETLTLQFIRGGKKTLHGAESFLRN
jgi:hypothetical protein